MCRALLWANNMGSYYRPFVASNRKQHWEGVYPHCASLMHLFFTLFLNWKQFTARGCFTVPFSALVAGRGVSKSHIYIPLHCLWAQSSKEMHNAGRLMTWNGPHESILIKWSTKDLPWRASPSRNEPAPNWYPGLREEPEQERAVQAAVSGGKTSSLCAPPSSNLETHWLPCISHPHISLPHCAKPLPPLCTLVTLGGTAAFGTPSQPMGMHPHLPILFAFHWAHMNCWPFHCRCLLWCLWSCRSRGELWAGWSSAAQKPPCKPPCLCSKPPLFPR